MLGSRQPRHGIARAHGAPSVFQSKNQRFGHVQASRWPGLRILHGIAHGWARRTLCVLALLPRLDRSATHGYAVRIDFSCPGSAHRRRLRLVASAVARAPPFSKKSAALTNDPPFSSCMIKKKLSRLEGHPHQWAPAAVASRMQLARSRRRTPCRKARN